jgi:predicted MFS family arabinose efflux permease
MTTLIARALLHGTAHESSGFLLALPAVMMGVGLALGQVIYGFLGSRILIHRLMRRGALIMVFAALFTAGAVWSGLFWLYCAAKLIMAIPFGLLYTLSYSLPRRADSDEVRALAAGGIKRTDTSAAALGTVMGGYVAQSLGNAWVYVLVAVLGVAVFLMAEHVLPRSGHPLEHDNGERLSRRQAVVRLVTSKTTLPIIFFIMLPAILSAGYNSFLFPLYSANLGLSTSSINNLFVLGQLVVYVCITSIEYVEGRWDKWRVAGLAVCLLGVVFVLFSFNTTLVWAVVTIALVGVLCKCADGWKALWPRSAASMGLHTGIATGAMFATRSVLLIVQPLLLGALLTMSNSVAVIIVGIICLVCSVLFYYTTRHSALAPEKQ